MSQCYMYGNYKVNVEICQDQDSYQEKIEAHHGAYQQ